VRTKINLTTFPRSGRTFLFNILQNFNDITINAYHSKDFIYLKNKGLNFNNKIKVCSICINRKHSNNFVCIECNYFNKSNNDFILNHNENYIGIIRNPYDSIISTYAMTTFFAFKSTCNKRINDGFDENVAIKETRCEMEETFHNTIDGIIEYYIKYYNFYLNNFQNILILKFDDIVNNIDLCLLKITKHFNITLNLEKYEKNPIVLQNTNNFLVSSKNNEWYQYAVNNINNNKMIEAEKLYTKLLNMVDQQNI